MTTQSTNEASLEARIPRRWLPAGRLIWLALALLAVAVYIAGLSPYYSELLATCSGEACSWMALSPREVEETMQPERAKLWLAKPERRTTARDETGPTG